MMHWFLLPPSVRQSARGRRLPTAARFWQVAGLLACLGTGAPAQDAPAPVSVWPVVQRRGVAAGQTFVGTVRPSRKSTVGSAVDGRVEEFLVNEGDRVEKNQPLARLRTRVLEIERAAALAEQEFRRQELAELENGSRPEEVEQAKAQMLAAKALMEYSQSKYDRTRSLVERRAASEEQLEDDSSAATRSLQAYYAAKAGHDLAVAGPREEQRAQARARLAAAEEEVRRLDEQLERHTIVAPFAGYVVAEHTEEGQWLKQGEPVAEIVELDQVEVEVMVLESYVPKLQVGAPARVEVGALADRLFTGQVARIVPEAEVRSRSFPVKVRLANEILPDGSALLKPGMFARVALPVERKGAVLLVPKDALVLGGREPMVYVVDPDEKDPKKGRWRAVSVRLGVALESLVEVAGALGPGEQVVVEGNERLRPGQEVLIVPLVSP